MTAGAKEYPLSDNSCKQLILIVDDEPRNIAALQDVLGQDYHLVFATNGEDALQRAQEDPQPDLILLDVRIPKIHGFEVCARLKNEAHTRNIPVIFLTARYTTSEEAQGLQLGAIDYIRRPFSAPVIHARIHNHLELKKHRDMLENLSTLDGLTNIPNRRRFDEIFAHERNRANRTKKPLSLLFIDIDHFKLYNDAYGHLQGDDCLRVVAKALQKTLSRPADFVARFGGEEFVVLLPDTGESGCRHLAHKILQAVDELRIVHAASPVAPHVTISIGAVTCLDVCRQTHMLDMADRLVYQAKQEGRHRICCGTLQKSDRQDGA